MTIMSIQPNIENNTNGNSVSNLNGERMRELEAAEERFAKHVMLRCLKGLADRGVKLSQSYSINSNLMAMRYEYAVHTGVNVDVMSVIADRAAQQLVITDVDHQFNEAIDSVEI
jgi:hypothetical protein